MKLVAIAVLIVATFMFAAPSLIFFVAFIKGEKGADGLLAPAMILGVFAFFSGYMLVRLVKGTRSAIPMWFFFAFGTYPVLLIVPAAIMQGAYWAALLSLAWPIWWILILMPAMKEERVLFARIREELRRGTIQGLESLAQARPGEKIYGLLFEVFSVGDHVSAVAATEEGLDRLVQKYVAMGYRVEANKSIDVMRQWLRWKAPETIYYTRAEGWYTNYESDNFSEAQWLIRLGIENGRVRRRGPNDSLIQLCLKTLEEMDAAGIFAERVERTQLVLGIFHHGNDTNDEMFLSTAAQINPPSVIDRLQRELQERRVAAQAIVAPPEEPEEKGDFAFVNDP